MENIVNKKQLIAAVVLLTADLGVEASTEGLEVKELEALHEQLTAQKAVQDELGEKQNSERLVLEFKKPYKRYSNGDVAGFSAKVGGDILKLKPAVAVEYVEKKTEKSAD